MPNLLDLHFALFLVFGLASCESPLEKGATTITLQIHRHKFARNDVDFISEQIRRLLKAEASLTIERLGDCDQLKVSARHSEKENAKDLIEAALDTFSERWTKSIPHRLKSMEIEIAGQKASVEHLRETLEATFLGKVFREKENVLGQTDQQMMIKARSHLTTLLNQQKSAQEKDSSSINQNLAYRINILRAFISDKAPAYQDDLRRELKGYFHNNTDLQNTRSRLTTLRVMKEDLHQSLELARPLFTIQKWEHH